MKPPEALQVGTALANHATGFVTNDGRLKRIRELEIMVLDEFLDGKTRT